MVGQDHDREERDLGELLERERVARRRLALEKHARLKIVSQAVRDLVAHAHVIEGWAELVKREPLNAADRTNAMTHIIAAVAQQLDTLDRLGLSTASLAERPVFELTRVNLTALLAAVVADSGDRAELEPPEVSSSATFVLADAEYVVRTVRTLIDAARSPARVSLNLGGRRAEVHVRDVPEMSAETFAMASLLANVQGGGLDVLPESVLFWLPMERPPEE